MEGLKERERRILLYMKDQIKAKGYPPTVREICQELHIKSTSTTHKDIANLEKKGYIRKDPSKPRALMIMDPDSLPESPDSTGTNTGPAGITLPMAMPIISATSGLRSWPTTPRMS